MDLLECAQRRVTKMIRGLDHHSYKNSLEKRNLRGNITGAFQYLKWACKNEGE